MKTNYTENEFKNAIKKSFSIAETCRILNIRPCGGNYKTIHHLIKKYSVDISHFTGQGWNVGLKFRPMKTYTLDEILIENSTYRSSLKLKNKLFNNNIKDEVCERCGNSVWEGEKIPLELHHVNGNNTDNRIENLQILCSNCHAQTENYRRGKSAMSDARKEEYLKNKKNIKIKVEPKEKKHKKERKCAICDNKLLNSQKHFCSIKCKNIGKKGKRPSVFELINKFKELKSFLQVGKFYGVSDNAIRKWCNYYDILKKN